MVQAFYMRLNEDNKTVAAMDLLVPKVGELVGGSQREERLDVGPPSTLTCNICSLSSAALIMQDGPVHLFGMNLGFFTASQSCWQSSKTAVDMSCNQSCSRHRIMWGAEDDRAVLALDKTILQPAISILVK